MKSAVLLATGVPAPPLNRVFTARNDAAADAVDHLLNLVMHAGLPHCLQIRPGCESNLEAIARARAMKPESPIPLMRMESNGTKVAAVAAHAGLVIRELRMDERHLHIAVASVGFEAPATLFDAVLAPAVLALPGVHCYVGSVDGQPVTTALGIVDGDHVGIYNVATLPAQRGRGYGAAITARAVLDGFAEGASFALLQSSDAGYRVYQQLGFRTLESWAVWVAS